jgi:sigma-B regulation protein RsbU (phosphoserine phosphatase)
MLLFVNAGHPPPFLCSRRTCSTAPTRPQNMLLGVESFEPEEGCHTFRPGERLVLYTDGIVEAANADGELFGEVRLHEALNAEADGSPDECADAVLRAVDTFRGSAPQKDDETIVAIDRV